jgi:hypothetical protein
MPNRHAVYELLGLVLRRQAPLWKTWQPWLALLGILGPVGVLLSKISVGVVSDIWRRALVYWQYGVPYSSGLTEAQEFETLVCVSLAIICWSWVGGFVLGTLSGDTLYVNGTLFCLVWFCLCGPLFVLIYAVRLLLNALHLVPLSNDSTTTSAGSSETYRTAALFESYLRSHRYLSLSAQLPQLTQLPKDALTEV